MNRVLSEQNNTEEILRILIETLLLIDKNGICVDVRNNNINLDINESLIGRNISCLFPGEQYDIFIQNINEAISNGNTLSAAFNLYVNGECHLIECTFYPYREMALCKLHYCQNLQNTNKNVLELEQRINELYEIAKISHWSYNSNERIVKYKGKCTLFHTNEHMCITVNEFRNLIVKEDLSSFERWKRRVEQGIINESFACRLILKDTLYYLQIQVNKLTKIDKDNYVVQGYIQNVTDIQRNRNDITTLTHAINNAKQQILAVAEDGTINFANRVFKQTYNIKYNTSVDSMKIFDLLKDIPTQTSWIKKCSSLKPGEYMDYIVYNPVEHNQDIIAFEYTLFHVTSDNKESSYWIFSNDISERIRHESQIKRLSEILDTVVDNLPAGIIVKDIDKEFAYIYRNTESFNRDFNISRDAIGKNDFDFFNNSVAQRKYEEDIKIATTGKPTHKIEELKDKAGHTLILDKRKIKIEKEGVAPMIICIEWDITQLELMRRELEVAKLKAERSDKLKSAFLANMSHEIRTPLNAIIGFSRLLAECDDLDDKAEYVDIIESNNEHLLKLINEILDLSKIESGIMTFSNNPVRVHKLCQDIHNTYSLRVPNDVELVFEDSDQDLIIETDKDRLFQVISNLIGNAIKFTSKGFISYGYKVEQQYVNFFIQDTGNGIPEEKLPSIFERFVKLNSSVPGSGLGLSICKTILERLGGSITASSTFGKGTRFDFRIPISQNEVLGSIKSTPTANTLFHIQPPKTDKDNSIVSEEHKIDDTCLKRDENSKSNKACIMVVEDQVDTFRLIEHLISKDYKLYYARNGVEAVALYEEVKPDLILMDIRMPELDGLTTTSIIRQISNSVPIIAQSAFDSKECIEASSEAGCNDFISKPLDKDKLDRIISKYL